MGKQAPSLSRQKRIRASAHRYPGSVDCDGGLFECWETGDSWLAFCHGCGRGIGAGREAREAFQAQVDEGKAEWVEPPVRVVFGIRVKLPDGNAG